jgi:hypothetical protein
MGLKKENRNPHANTGIVNRQFHLLCLPLIPPRMVTTISLPLFIHRTWAARVIPPLLSQICFLALLYHALFYLR